MPASASAGRSSACTYFTAAQISTSAGTRSRTRSRFARTRAASIIEVKHPQAALAAGEAAVAAVGEIQVGTAARAVFHVLHVAHSAAASFSARTARRSSMRPRATPGRSANASSTSGPTS